MRSCFGAAAIALISREACSRLVAPATTVAPLIGSTAPLRTWRSPGLVAVGGLYYPPIVDNPTTGGISDDVALTPAPPSDAGPGRTGGGRPPVRHRRPSIPRLHCGHRGHIARTLPPDGRSSRAGAGRHAHPRAIHDRAQPAAAGADRPPRRRAAGRPRLAVLRELGQRGDRGRHAPGAPCDQPPGHRRLPRVVP